MERVSRRELGSHRGGGLADYPLISGGDLGRGHRIGALAVATLLTGFAAVCLPYGDLQLRAAPGFMPAFGALSILVDGLTAGLLLAQARLAGNLPAMRLGAAYLFSALVTAPYLLAFPNPPAGTSLIGAGASATWLWCAWHCGFALLVIHFVMTRRAELRPGQMGPMIALVCLAVSLMAVASTTGLPWLPSLQDGHYGRLTTIGIGPAILGLTATAGVLVVARLRCKDVLALWLAVALLAALLDVALTLFGGGLFTLGWYAARVLSLMTGVCVLFALLSALMREAGRVAEANARLEQALQTDVLTALSNRRAFDAALAAEWRRAQREQTPMSLLMVDIDCFKGFNDRYGHPAGDSCLRAVAGALASQAYRPADMAARIGGEEFGILLPVTDAHGAMQVAERLRASVAALLILHPGSGTGTVTVSVGAATIYPFSPDAAASHLVSTADRALYRAKEAGRNRVCGGDATVLDLVTA